MARLTRGGPGASASHMAETIETRIHASYRCGRCGAERKAVVTRKVVGTGDDQAAIEASARDLAMRIATADLGLVRCPKCGKRARIGYHTALFTALFVPAAAVGITSMRLGRVAVGVVGALFSVLIAYAWWVAIRSAERAVRFEE